MVKKTTTESFYCRIGACERVAAVHGLCHAHYQRWHREGRVELDEWIANAGGGQIRLLDRKNPIDPAEQQVLACLGSRFVPTKLIAEDCGLSEPDLCRIINCLKDQGKVIGRLHPATGQWEIGKAENKKLFR